MSTWWNLILDGDKKPWDLTDVDKERIVEAIGNGRVSGLLQDEETS